MNKEASMNLIATMSMLKSDNVNNDMKKIALKLLPTLLVGGIGTSLALTEIEKQKKKAAERARQEMMAIWGPFIQGLMGPRGNIGYQEAIGRTVQ